MSEVVVAGIGILTSIGDTPEKVRESLNLGRTGISKPSPSSPAQLSDNYPTGRIDISNNSLNKLAYGDDTKGVTRTDAIAKIAFDKAILDASLDSNDLSSSRLGFFSASTVGGMDHINELYKDATQPEEPSEYISSYSPSVHLQKIVRQYNMTGPMSVINTACSSSANAIMLGAKLLKANKIDIAIVGGVDSWSAFTFRGFNALGILSTESCQPFDENRKGLNLGEAGAYLVMMKENNPKIKKSYGKVCGWSNSNDSFHASALNEDGSGIIKCIQKALDVAEISTNQVSFINAHGTGTGNNDLAESVAISKLFEPTTPYFSTKSFTGHTLGAAGAIEAVFTLVGLQHDEIYPSLRITAPLVVANSYNANTEVLNQPCNFALSNSFGFNGNCTSLIFGKA